MTHAGVYEQLKRCQVLDNGMVRTWLSRWSVAARLPGMCGGTSELRWVAEHVSYTLMPPPGKQTMQRRLKYNFRFLTKDSLKEVVSTLLFLRELLHNFASEFRSAARPA